MSMLKQYKPTGSRQAEINVDFRIYNAYGQHKDLSGMAVYREFWDEIGEIALFERNLGFYAAIPGLIDLVLQGNEKLSMLITDISRMGKTYFTVLLGAMLISLGYAVHLIDLGYKWSDRDKEYLLSEGAVMRRLAKERLCNKGKKVFVIIDEFQNLDCDRKSIIGTCLTEGQKYGLALILVTQFLKGNFSEAVVSQFKQGGFRFYFRLTEEEAAKVSRELAGNSRDRECLYNKLVTLPRGQCLMKGPHAIQGSVEATEVCRFVEIWDKADA